MKSRIDRLKEKHAEELAEAQAEEVIYRMLPDEVPDPTVSNLRADPGPLEPSGWLSFRGPSYDPQNTFNPAAVLAALERAGWVAVPATLIKWDNYRRCPHPGAAEDVPPEKPGAFGGKYKLTDADPIAPVWVDPNQYTAPEAQLFMRAPDGRVFRVSVNLPRSCYLTAQRSEHRGGWSFVRGTAQIHYPEHWGTLPSYQISQHTRAWVDTEQGVSGAVYWERTGDGPESPASEFVAALLATTPAAGMRQ